MEISDRRDFLKKSVVAGASLLMAPSILNASLDRGITKRLPDNEDLIVPKSGGLKITGTFWMKYLMIFHIKIGDSKNGIWIFNI